MSTFSVKKHVSVGMTLLMTSGLIRLLVALLILFILWLSILWSSILA